MKAIKSAYFIKSATLVEQYPQHDLPEIAFIGRSNVGKSSLLNTLVNKKNLARTSNSPGRTQVINFFNVEDRICFVDLPGYGFAKVPQAIKDQWQPMIETYLTQRANLQTVVLILDARHRPTQQDRMMRDWLGSYQIPMITVATKIDKLATTKVQPQIKLLRETLRIPLTEQVLPFSALTKEGLQAILKTVWQHISIPV